MSFANIVHQIKSNVDTDGHISDAMSQQLFATFPDSNIWSPFDIDCAIPYSSFYITKLTVDLNPISITQKSDPKGDVYLIIRNTKDDYTKYVNYLVKEYQSYSVMEENGNDLVTPICHTQNNCKEGFLFAFLSPTKLTLNDVIDNVKQLPLKSKLTCAINLISNVDLANQNITGFHISPKTILVDSGNEEMSIGFIGFIGGINELNLCQSAAEFNYNTSFSPPELEKKRITKIRVPNSLSDVYALAKIIQILFDNEPALNDIPLYEEIMVSSLEKFPKDRISLDEFKNKMREIRKELIRTSINDKKPQVINIQTDNKKPQDSFNKEFLKKFIKVSIPEKHSEIYQLPTYTDVEDPKLKLRKITVGEKKSFDLKETINILIVGKTGSGKTTFLNGIANYLFGVKWEDNFRLIIVTDLDERTKDNPLISESESKTDYVTAYTFPHHPDSPFKGPVTIIDTPGFGDTRGFQRDLALTKQLTEFFKNKNYCGSAKLNAVSFVIQSSQTKLDTSQKYVFDSILNLFGKDIKENFLIIATFADAGSVNAKSALEAGNIPTENLIKFNNSALYAKPDKAFATIHQMFWNIGKEGYSKIFNTYIKNIPGKSLEQTNQVLSERKKLEDSVKGITFNIQVLINQMNEIKIHYKLLQDYDAQIIRNKNYKTIITVTESEHKLIPPEQKVTNCTKCHTTCHDDCVYGKGESKINCTVMNSNGYCNICGHHYSDHTHMDFMFVHVKRQKETTIKEILKLYKAGLKGKEGTLIALRNAKEKCKNLWVQTHNLMDKCRKCINELKQIALLPISHSAIDYLKQLIEDERKDMKDGWEGRIQTLTTFLHQQEFILKLDKKDKGGNSFFKLLDNNIDEFLNQQNIKF